VLSALGRQLDHGSTARGEGAGRPLLETMHSDLGFDRSNLLIPRTLTGERQDIVLSHRRFRGSVLAEVLGGSESR
jgi:hypothetical protein